MAKKQRRSFFEKLTGSIRLSEDEAPGTMNPRLMPRQQDDYSVHNPWADAPQQVAVMVPEEEVEGELALDVYQNQGEIIVQTFVAGVRPEDLEINITREMITIRGRREETRTIAQNDFFTRELYWGSFSRTVMLPQEVEPEEAEAIERHGLLTIRLPKINKNKASTLKVKSI